MENCACLFLSGVAARKTHFMPKKNLKTSDVHTARNTHKKKRRDPAAQH